MVSTSRQVYRELLSNRAVSVLAITQLVRTLGRSQVWIFIPVYLLLIRHVQYFDIGLLFFTTAMISLPVSIFGGNMVDRLGRRKVGIIIPPILVFVFFSLSASAFLGLPLVVIFASFVAIEPLVTIQGIVDNVLVTDIVEDSKRNDAFSLLRIAANLGFSIGPAMGGYLAYLNYGFVFIAPALISVLDFMLFFKYIQEPVHKSSISGNFTFPTRDTKFIIVCILLAMIWFVTGQWGTTLTLFWTHFDHLTNRFIGDLYGLNGVFVVTMQIPTNWLFRRTSDHLRIAIGGLVYSFSFLALAFFTGPYFLVLDVFFITMGENIISPVAFSMIGKIAPPDKRGQYFGAFQMIVGFAVPFAPLMGTYLLGYYSNQAVSFWSIIASIGVTISLVVYAYGRGRISQTPAARES